MLEPSLAAPYLRALQLLDDSAIGSGTLRIVPARGRTGGLRVEVDGAPSYFLKQAAGSLAELVRRESEVYVWLWRQFGDGPPFAPYSYGFDEANLVLVLEVPPNCQTLLEAEASKRRSQARYGGLVALALAELHTMTWTGDESELPRNQFGWLERSVPALDIDLYATLDGGTRACVAAMQQEASLVRAIERLGRDWRADHAIHGDIRAANVLVTAGPRGRVWLVDWEFAGLGDASWDTGCFLAEYLALWVASVPASASMPIDVAVARARRPLHTMNAATQTFWRTYVKRMKLSPVGAREWLERSARFAAARLVKSALESKGHASMTNCQILLLQLAQNIFDRPLEAMEGLLGLR